MLQKQVRRPERWGIAPRCDGCGWRQLPAGPWRVRDVLAPPKPCPTCRAALRVRSISNTCGAERTGSRWPSTLRQELWGGWTGAGCATVCDKWGRPFAS